MPKLYVSVKKLWKQKNGKVLVNNWIKKVMTNKFLSLKGHANGKNINVYKQFKKKRKTRITRKTRKYKN